MFALHLKLSLIFFRLTEQTVALGNVLLSLVAEYATTTSGWTRDTLVGLVALVCTAWLVGKLLIQLVCIKCKCTLTFDLHRFSTLANFRLALAGGLFTLHVDKLLLASSYLDRHVLDRLLLMVEGMRLTTTIGWIASAASNGTIKNKHEKINLNKINNEKQHNFVDK